MIQKRTLIGILLVAVLLGMVPAFSLATPDLSRPMQEGTNLLKNPGFEESYSDWNPGDCPSCPWGVSCIWDICMTAKISAGWIPFWQNCADGDPDCGFGMPEFKPAAPYTDRIHTGNNAQQYFSTWEKNFGGLFQTVANLEPGATVALSAYAQGWSTNTGGQSDQPLDNLVFRVGIDPTGGIDPWSPSITWSQLTASPDAYRLIGPVEAQVGAEGKVTVFLYSTVQHYPFRNNDAYWDDASLVVTAPGVPPTSTPLPPPPTATPGPSPTPRDTPTPRPDGATVHIVESGDTLFGIALMYGVDVDQIRELNAGSLGPNDLLSIDQVLVISLPSVTPTPTPLPPPPTPEPTSPAPASPTPPAGSSLCVLAYHDRNGDALWDEATEELLPNAEFTVADTSGVIAQYVSDGLNEPYCFTGLAAGAYRVIQSPPPGYEPSGPAEWPVALAEGTGWDFQFGNVRSGSPAAPGETAEPTPAGEGDDESSSSLTFSSIFSIVAKISGVLVLILAAGVAVLFVLNRRRM